METGTDKINSTVLKNMECIITYMSSMSYLWTTKLTGTLWTTDHPLKLHIFLKNFNVTFLYILLFYVLSSVILFRISDSPSSEFREVTKNGREYNRLKSFLIVVGFKTPFYFTRDQIYQKNKKKNRSKSLQPTKILWSVL